MNGLNFRADHLMLDEQAGQIFAKTAPIAEGARKLGGITFRSLSNIAEHVDPRATEVKHGENEHLVAAIRQLHSLCAEHLDIAIASLIEIWFDETKRRAWLLYEGACPAFG